MPSIATTLSFASLLAFSVSALNQCEIASAAWLAMGGSSAQGPLITNATACCNNRGIACDTTIIDHMYIPNNLVIGVVQVYLAPFLPTSFTFPIWLK